MQPFQYGDRVRCLDASWVKENLTEGDIYYVMDASEDGFVSLRGVDGSYRADRFVLSDE